MVYRLVNSTYNIEELTLRLTRLLCQFIKADSSSIYILDSLSKKVILKALFNNQINILKKKKKELEQELTAKESKVLQGYCLFEKQVIGLPLVADDIVGAIFIKRRRTDPQFNEFDKEMLSVVVEQSVTAIKNLQLYENQQKIILGSIEFIGKLLKQQGPYVSGDKNASEYFKVLKVMAEKLDVREDAVENLYYVSILRDAGAIDVPYDILSKSSQLTPEEFKIIREQPTKSANLIRPVDFLKPILPIILYHHEKYDGSGYPSGIKKEQIPIGARLMAVVDAYCSMVGERPYKKPLTDAEAVKELKSNSGSQFDPRVVKVFLELHKQKKFRKSLRLANMN